MSSNNSKGFNIFTSSTSKEKLLLGIVLLVNALGIFNNIFNGDSSLYASISKNIATSSDYIHLNSLVLSNWIDKPHFGFWIWSTFIKFFGYNNLGFKLPTFLSFLILLRYTYLFTRLYYYKEIAFLSILILSSCLHIIISNNDVRIDMFLICFMMGAIYHFHKYIHSNKILQVIMGIIFSSIAIMTKGIFIAIPIGVSILAEFAHTKSLKKLVRPIWFISFILILIGISPALYALKIQFKTYGNQLILGQEASDYLKFFFWDSQFGRFKSNLGQVESNGDPFFYFHTLLWALAPWSLLLLKSFFLKKNPFKEYSTISCTVILLIILSISKTQLSHHSLLLLPFLSIILSLLICDTKLRISYKYLEKIHYFILILIPIGTYTISYILLGFQSLILIGISMFIIVMLFMIKRSGNITLVHSTLLVSIFLGLFLNLVFYPKVLEYQAGTGLAKYLSKVNHTEPIYDLYSNVSLANYYSDNKIISLHDSTAEENLCKGSILLSSDYAFHFLKSKSIEYKVLEEFNDFRTTVLDSNFIYHKTREQRLKKFYLIEIMS